MAELSSNDRRHIAEQRICGRFKDNKERQKFYNEMLSFFGKNGLKDISDEDFVEYVNRKLK